MATTVVNFAGNVYAALETASEPSCKGAGITITGIATAVTAAARIIPSATVAPTVTAATGVIPSIAVATAMVTITGVRIKKRK